MGASGFGRRSLFTALLAALIAAVVSFVFVPTQAEEAKAQNPSEGMQARDLETGETDWPEPYETDAREPQIVGGNPVPNGRYSFMAFVQIEVAPNRFARCGGTLIDRDSVLTAAHCVSVAQSARVTVGRTLLSSAQGQVRDVESIFIHPRYNGLNFAYDAAVLKLESPVTGIRPVALAGPRQNGIELPGRFAVAAGWGTTTEGGRVSDRMRAVVLPIRRDPFAKQAYAATNNPRLQYFSILMVAAGVAGRDACQGDSGGPLFTAVRNTNVQMGITSYGLGCARRGFPGVWTEVNSPFIRGFIVRAARN